MEEKVISIADFIEYIHEKKWNEIKDVLLNYRSPEIRDYLIDLTKIDRNLVFKLIPDEKAVEVFSYLPWKHQYHILLDIEDEKIKYILTKLSPDDRVFLLEELPQNERNRFLDLLEPADKDLTEKILSFPHESVGRLITPNFVKIQADMVIGDALKRIRQLADSSETVNMIYVTDKDGVLLDSLKLKEFILAPPNRTVKDLMDNEFISLSAFDDREVAVKKMDKYDLVALPVLDKNDVIIGIVTHDDIMDVAEEEVTEDFHKSAAVSPLQERYSMSTIGVLFKKRISWLLILIIVNLSSSTVIAAYEEVLESLIALAFFIPLLIGSGGNTGAQSATLIIRAIATGDLKMKKFFKTLLKEVKIGAMLGITMAFASFFLGLIRGNIQVGIIVGVSMFFIIIASNIIGIILPVILTKCKLDPAVASSPLITSIADAAGLIMYFFIAQQVLNIFPTSQSEELLETALLFIQPVLNVFTSV